MDAQDTLSAVEAFLKTTGMTATAFGRGAVGDPGFVFDLRDGRRIWPETEGKVRAFIEAHPVAKAS